MLSQNGCKNTHSLTFLQMVGLPYYLYMSSLCLSLSVPHIITVEKVQYSSTFLRGSYLGELSFCTFPPPEKLPFFSYGLPLKCKQQICASYTDMRETTLCENLFLFYSTAYRSSKTTNLCQLSSFPVKIISSHPTLGTFFWVIRICLPPL